MKKIHTATDNLALKVHKLVDQVHALIAQVEQGELRKEKFLQQIQSMCGIPNSTKACRLILEAIDKHNAEVEK